MEESNRDRNSQRPGLFSKWYKWTVRNVREIDMFGAPVSLNFKGETAFKTTIGGIVTIASIIVIIIFLGIFTNTLFSRDSTNLKFIVKTDNLADKSEKHYIGEKGVYFAIYDKGSTTSIIENKAYLNLKVYQATTKRDTSGAKDVYTTTLSELSTSECNKRFYSKVGISTSQKYDLDTMIGTDSLNYAIGGNSLSSEYNYIHIVLTKGTGQSYGKSDDEITAALNKLNIGVAMTDYFFDGDNYESPIQINPATGYEYIPISSMKKNVMIKIRQTLLIDGQNYFTSDFDQGLNFYSIGEQKIDMSAQDKPGEFMNIDLVLDNKYQSVNRQVFTMIDLAVYVGGISEVGAIVGSFIVGIFSYRIYMTTMLGSFYQIKCEKNSTNVNKVVPDENTNSHPKLTKIDDAIDNIAAVRQIDRENSINKTTAKVVEQISKRRWYIFEWKTIIYSIFGCPRGRCVKKNSETYKNNQQFDEGGKLLQQELDLYNLLNSIRNANALSSLLLDQKQKVLCKYQHSNLIDLIETEKKNNEKDNSSSTINDTIQDDINILLTGGGVDHTHEVNRILIQGIEGKVKDLVYPIQYLHLNSSKKGQTEDENGRSSHTHEEEKYLKSKSFS